MLNQNDSNASELVRWDIQNHIVFQMQAHNFYLDPLVPRIVHLALNSSDRKTKIAACELFHTIVLYLIGTNKLSKAIWNEICTNVICLGCDPDAAVKDMFAPLLYQIVRYLAQPDFIHLKGTQDFIAALLQLLSCPNNNSIQDLSANLLQELVKKVLEYNKKDHVTTPINLNTLFNKLKFYSMDADMSKRKAAVLAFNNLYSITKDDDNMVSTLWLELFQTYCLNYIMSEEFYMEHYLAPELDQHNTMMDNFLKVFLKKKNIFETQSSTRIIPLEFKTGKLRDVAVWILHQCGARQRNYRLKNMCLFVNLARILSKEQTIQSFNDEINVGESELIEIFENQDGLMIAHHTDLEFFFAIKPPFTAVREWLSSVLIALDGYTWIINSNLLASINNLITHPSSKLLTAITYCLQNVLFASMEDIISGQYFDISLDTHEINVNYREIEKIKNLKQQFVIKLLELLRNILLKDPTALPIFFLQDHCQKLIQLVELSVFDSETLHFSIHDTSDINNARKLAVNFMITVQEKVEDEEMRKKFASGFVKVSTLFLLNFFVYRNFLEIKT